MMGRILACALCVPAAVWALSACDQGGGSEENSADRTPPTTPTGLQVTAPEPQKVQLQWNAATDSGTGVAGYRVFRNDLAGAIATVAATSHEDRTVAAGTTYTYVIRAFDGAGNVSEPSSAISATTPASPDSTPPPAPTGLTAVVQGASSVLLSWTASNDPSGIIRYEVQRDGVKIADVAGNATTFLDSTISPVTTYSYAVRAIDGANNASALSNAAAVTTPAVSASFGLEWPGDGAVRRMLFWHNPFPIYDATYVFKVFPRKKTSGAFRYYTTFFWGNDGSFIWDGGVANTYYGAHPYPIPAPIGPGQWEISVYSNDFVTGSEVQWDRWYTQAFRAWRESPSVTHHEFYWDLPDTSKVISKTIVDANWANKNPPTPAIHIGQAAWQFYAGDEEFNGIIRGIQIYSGLLSVADIQSEIAAPKSTAAGRNFIWYLNVDPRPSDVTDKKGIGTPHNPLWRGTTALEWTGAGAINITTSGATIAWTTNEPADSQVEYGTTPVYGQTTTVNPSLATSHAMSLSALSADTTYHFRVRSRDAAGNNSASSSDFTFKTAAPGASTVTALAAYGFNEAADSVTADASDRGFRGTLVNGPVWTSGHSGNALSFDGVNDKVSLPAALDISRLPFTLEAWILPTSRSDWRAIFSKRSSYSATQMRFDVGLSITTGRVYVTTARSFVTFTYAPPLNAWTHLAVVAESSGTKLYVNGALKQTLAAVVLGTKATAPVTIGNTGDDDDPFAGIIDDLRLYDRALSASDIQSDMTSGLF